MTGSLRLALALIFGLVGWYAIVVAADYMLVSAGELPPGVRYTALGLVQLVFGGAIIWLALRFARLRLTDAGLVRTELKSDTLVGIGIGFTFAAVQFLLIIPATGGAARSDVVANAAQIGETYAGFSGILILALLGSTSEELLFRGLLLFGLAKLCGGGTAGKIVSTIVVTTLFALSHGYQGWAGIIDTGFYGGLLMSLLYWWRGMRLAAPIAAHATWNLIAATVIFVAY